MPVKGSESYVWFTDQKLDTGTNREVYFGRNKVSGVPCVIKLAKENILQKQLDKFKKLNNKNLVKFLGMEYSKHKELIIAMEYCDEKCLLKFMEKPENIYGLNDHDVIHLHGDIICGLEVLANVGLPKDYYLKPSNILCSLELNGNITFKIADYLYDEYETQNDLYFINIVRKMANILIWSLGALFCNAILGTSPFSNSLDNAEKMIRNKSEDDIFISDSGLWQSLFPQTIQLTSSLQTIFSTLIKGCMNLKNQIDLNKFFESKLRSTYPNTVVYVFDPSTLNFTAFISKSEFGAILTKDSFAIFEDKMIQCTGDLDLFEKRISQKKPVIYFNFDMEPKLPELKQILNDAYMNIKQTQPDDVSYAKNYNGFLLFCLRLNEKVMLSRKGLKQICTVLIDKVDVKLSMIKLKLDILRSQGSYSNMVKNFDDLKKKVHSIKDHSASDQENPEVFAVMSQLEPPPESCFQAFLKDIAEQALKTYDTFVQDANKQLTHNELQVHKYEKAKLREKTKKAHQLFDNQLKILINQFSKYKEILTKLNKDISPNVDKLVDNIDDGNYISNGAHHESGYYSVSHIALTQKHFINEINKAIKRLNDLTEEFEEILGKIT